MKRKTWRSKLTKAEREHVREWCNNTKTGLINNLRDMNPDFVCYDCQRIAEKLGIDTREVMKNE